MKLEELIITLYNSTEEDFQAEFSTRLNPIEYQNSLQQFKALRDEALPFLYSLKPIIDNNTDSTLVELVDELDNYID